MKVKNLNVQLLRLPSDIEFILFLLKEELKSNRLLNGLTKLGFDDSYHRSDFSTMILASFGFDERPDELYAFYFKLRDAYTEKLEGDNKKIVKYAFSLYVDLVIEKRRRSPF